MSLRYDPLLRLHETNGTAVNRYLYDGTDLVAEYNGAGTLLYEYVHGPGADEPIVDTIYAGGQGYTFYFHPDERGSIHLASRFSGHTIAPNTLDEYGNMGWGNFGRFQFTGQTWLPDIFLYNYKARIYHPGAEGGGRFLQTDPTGYEDGPDWYTYAGADPVNKVDPTGTQSVDDMQTQARMDDLRQQGYSERQILIVVGNEAKQQASGLIAFATTAPSIGAGAVHLTARSGFSATRIALAAAERGGEAGLRRTMVGATTSIRNIIKNNATLKDFLGAARESRGAKTGFDHVTEMRNSVSGLQRVSDSLAGSLKNPTLSTETRATLSGWKKAADTAIERMKKVLDD